MRDGERRAQDRCQQKDTHLADLVADTAGPAEPVPNILLILGPRDRSFSWNQEA